MLPQGVLAYMEEDHTAISNTANIIFSGNSGNAGQLGFRMRPPHSQPGKYVSTKAQKGATL